MNEKVDILAIGAHPDDVEIGMAGTIVKYSKLGYKIAICDLTEAELSSNGNTELRRLEAQKADKAMGVIKRFNLSLPDRHLFLKEEYIKQIVDVIRLTKPTAIFAPFEVDRHPDHGNCSRLVEEAVFSAGVKKFQTDLNLNAHKVDKFYHYMINGFHKPSFYIDITDSIDGKIAALNAYESQFTPGENGEITPLTNDYVNSVVSREKLFGKEVGVSYAEGFISKRPILLQNDFIGEKK
jgi:bacillithiol biosynthesis deacetylase BshB1